ncbi:hypothetical protein [Streptomyces mirabilis]|uniref:hypothetical protein n=1 Tax=Streptomyces mirabilis TaxID=68239 RepID=UPI0033F7D0EB
MPELRLVISTPEPSVYDNRDTDRMDVVEALETAGWTGDDDNPLGILRRNGAVWSVYNDSGDSGLTCPNNAVLDFPSDTPTIVVVAACLAAASAAPTN